MVNYVVLEGRMWISSDKTGDSPYKYFGFIESQQEYDENQCVLKGKCREELAYSYYQQRSEVREERNAQPFDIWFNMNPSPSSATYFVAIRDDAGLEAFKKYVCAQS